ncbi:MAG TPA: DUF2281 domain-containing protein [Candidatus Lokiarchaeia archaeon]|nr:DUF2281 domain-containing protein [Candidatus Lokiarchaeia archaeon]
MQKKDVIIQELNHLPEELLDDVLAYVQFLESKMNRKKNETALLSESALGKDWLRPEEDEAWQDL